MTEVKKLKSVWKEDLNKLLCWDKAEAHLAFEQGQSKQEEHALFTRD